MTVLFLGLAVQTGEMCESRLGYKCVKPSVLLNKGIANFAKNFD